MKPAYYNEFDTYAAEWLRNLIAAGHIPAGDVDTRSIVDVQPDDLRGYGQARFFAGIGGWPLACRLAGWPDSREIWTGSAPCQPFSVAGKRKAQNDDRHLWPHLFRLVSARRPAVFMGEQVAAAIGGGWLDGVLIDLEGNNYAGRAVVLPACAVNAPHRRDRLWVVAERVGAVGHAERARLEGLAEHGDGAPGRPEPNRSASAASCGGAVADCDNRDTASARDERGPQSPRSSHGLDAGRRGAWDGAVWIAGHDGKARRIESGIRLLADGVPGRVGQIRAYGNAIVPEEAAEVIGAFLDTTTGNGGEA